MMVMVGTWLFGSYSAGRAFMLVEAFTVFLALIGTTLACLNTGARVTYAMGKDAEVPEHFGMLHGSNLTPHRSIWTLAVLSAIVGIVTVSVYLGGTTPAPLDPKYSNIWYSFGIFNPATIAKLPNTLVVVTLISNFGTFLLYMLTCIIAIVAFREHHTFSGFKHMVVPVFGLVANLLCMLFYLVGPFTVSGMSVKEPYIALGGLRGLGRLRRDLLRAHQQGQGQDGAARAAAEPDRRLCRRPSGRWKPNSKQPAACAFEASVVSDVGTEREHNEDQCACFVESATAGIVAVADGVSSFPAGETASKHRDRSDGAQLSPAVGHEAGPAAAACGATGEHRCL